ncbi:MAG: class I SAM-dependent methyltransferase [bacterium]
MDASIYKTMDAVESYHWWFVSRAKIIRNLLKKTFKKRTNLKILDVGCGTGGNFKLLSEFGDITGVEPDRFAFEQAKSKKLSKTLINGDFILCKELENKKFDLIVLTDVLEHIEKDELALSKIRNMLLPNGSLLITVPANMNLWSKHDTTHHHFRRYSFNELKRKLLGANFKIEFLSYFNFYLFPIVFLGRKLKFNENKDDVDITNGIANNLFKFIFSLESYSISRRIKFPIGVSLITICKK